MTWFLKEYFENGCTEYYNISILDIPRWTIIWTNEWCTIIC